MSTAVSMQIVLPAATPEPPRFSLISGAQPITQDRWEGGAGLLGYAVGVPAGWDPCLEGTFRTKDSPEAVPAPLFNSFQAYLGIECSGMGIGPWSEFRSRVDAVARAAASFPLERQLVHGDPMSGNPHLADANLDQIGTDGITPKAGLAYLEAAIAETGRRGVIHSTTEVTTSWAALGLVKAEDANITASTKLLTTAKGTPVVVGGGYADAAPSGKTASAGTNQWAFATGPVLAGVSDVIPNPGDVSEALDRTLNDVVYRAELDLLVAWDTQLQVGVLIDWSL